MRYSIKPLLQSWLLISVLAISQGAQAAYLPQPVPPEYAVTYPYNMTGKIVSNDAGALGSGAVVKYPKVVISCAHVVYDYGWQNGNYFFRGWNEGYSPDLYQGTLLRGYWYYSSYSEGTSDYAFSLDFVTHYGYENLANGGYGGSFADGIGALKSGRSKTITGYPSGLYPSGHSLRHRMHATGVFTWPFYDTSYSTYLGVDEVSTGPGNSGGPVWIYDSDNWYFAGVLVSGLSRSLGDYVDSAGVRAMNQSAWDMVDKAHVSAGGIIPKVPEIQSHPNNVYTYLGQNAQFSVTASGAPTPNYRWQIYSGGVWSDLYDDGNYSGTGTKILTVYNVTATHGYNAYRIRAVNSAGTAYSIHAQIIPMAPPLPTISVQPGSRQVGTGDSVMFTSFASGMGTLTYQWRKDGYDIPGATRRTYTIDNIQLGHAGSYRVAVSNLGGTVRSQTATLTVLPRYTLNVNTFPSSFSGNIGAFDPPQPAGGYLAGTEVSITAGLTAENGYMFYGWTGSKSETGTNLRIAMDSDKYLTAHFRDSKILFQHTDGRLATWFMSGINFQGNLDLKPVPAGWRLFGRDSSSYFTQLYMQHTDGNIGFRWLDGNIHVEFQPVRWVSPQWRAFGMADSNGDNLRDIYFQHSDNRLAVWYMEYGEMLNSALLRGGQPIGAGWKAMAAHDFDGNSSGDIIFQHASDGRIVIWLMNGTSLVSAVKVRDGLGSNGWTISGVMDFNNDGKKDLVMQHLDRRYAIWFMDGTTFTSSQILRNGNHLAEGWSIVGTK